MFEWLTGDVITWTQIAMAALAVVFMVPATVYAFLLRNKIRKTLLIMAASKHLYKQLLLILIFAFSATFIHLLYHIGDWQNVTPQQEFVFHMAIDASLVLISISIYSTFRQVYGILQGGKSGKQVEEKLRNTVNGIIDNK